MAITIEPLTEEWRNAAARLCAEQWQTPAANARWLDPPSREDSVEAIAAVMRGESANNTPFVGFVAIERGTVRAVLAGSMAHNTPDSFLYCIYPANVGLLGMVTCAADSPDFAAECFPALFEAWRVLALAEGIDYIGIRVPVNQWAVGAVWRRLGFRPTHMMAAQPCAGWQPMPEQPIANLHLRQATADDIETLTDLALSLWLYHADLPDSTTPHDVARDTLKHEIIAGINQPNRHYLLAEVIEPGTGQRRPAGFVNGNINVSEGNRAPRLYLPRRRGYLQYGVSAPDVRGTGVGTALCNAVMRWFIAQGVPVVFLDYFATNPLSSRFWSRRGFAPFIEELGLFLNRQ